MLQVHAFDGVSSSSPADSCSSDDSQSVPSDCRRHVPTWSPNDVSDDYFLGDTDTECCPSPDYYFFLIFFLPQDVFALNCSVHAQTSQLGCQQKILTSTERFLCSVILTKQKPTRKP